MVGSLSALNGVAGAFSADLPLLVVAGAPNTLDEQCRHIIHHTIGELDLNQSARCYEPVVAKVLSIRHIQDVQGTKLHMFSCFPATRHSTVVFPLKYRCSQN